MQMGGGMCANGLGEALELGLLNVANDVQAGAVEGLTRDFAHPTNA